MPSTRRRFLYGTTVASAAALAGCSALWDDGDETGSEGPGDDPDTPEAAARVFVERCFGGQYEGAVDLFSDRTRGDVEPAQIERIRLGFESVLGTYESVQAVETGVQSGYDSVELTLAFERGTGPLRVLTTDAELEGVSIDGEYEPASYADESAFETSEHVLDRGDCRLGATLATPADVDAAPGVVIVHGSHAQDRDGTIGANKPYRDLAEGLASRGVAVLRYEKRTYACNVPPVEHTVDRVTVEDAVAALGWLRERESVVADEVSVVGHSLGAMMAPEIAARDGDVAGAVGLASPARPLPEVFLDQIEYLADVGELTFDPVAEQRDRWQRMAEQVESGNYEPDEVLLSLPGAFWTSVEGYDPVAAAGELDVPQAYAQGGRDYQVSPEADFGRWRDAFGDDQSVSLWEYPDLDHAFLPGAGPSVSQSYAVPNQVAEALVADLADWVRG